MILSATTPCHILSNLQFHTEVKQVSIYTIHASRTKYYLHNFPDKLISLFLLCAEYPPDLPTLRRFPVRNGFIDIAAKIGTDYELFGTFLLQDNDGNKVKTIERSEHDDPLRITVEILRQWLQGNGKLPVSWETLVQCLRNSNLNVISDSIETSLLEHGWSNDLEHAHSDEL